MKSYFDQIQNLKKKAFRSYWEKRILSEMEYLTELLYEENEEAKRLLNTAAAMLSEEYEQTEQISVTNAKNVETLLLPLSKEAKRITLICAAHAHIDMNWMWGMQETVTVTIDTVRTMLTLMEEYPGFTFSQSQASVYEILEKYAPSMLEEVKKRVKEGRWEVTASTWVEGDKNMPNGESLTRQYLYTKQYLSKLLDISEESLNLDFEPDTFGHSANLPEIMTKSGVTRYYHCRGYEGENIYRWRSLSGKEVLVYREPAWYNADIEGDMVNLVPAFCKQYGINKMLKVYGVGDHGGGPTRRDIDRLLDMNNWPLYPRLQFGTFREFYDYLETKKETFPVVEQELNYVFTGCYTTQSRIKMANHVGENRLMEAEMLDSMAKLTVETYKCENDLQDAWKAILFNQFHDILPGSGTVETREYALGQFQNAMAKAGVNASQAMNAIGKTLFEADKDIIVKDLAMGAGAGMGSEHRSGFGFSRSERGSGSIRHLMLYNVTQKEQTEPTEIILWDWQEDLKQTRVTDLDGNEYPMQVLEEGTAYFGHRYCKILTWIPVPAMGYTICRVDVRPLEKLMIPKIPDPRKDMITDEPVVLENDEIRAVFDVRTMKCSSLIRKVDGKVLITPEKPALGLLQITEDTYNRMTSWRVGRSEKYVDLNESCFVEPGVISLSGKRKEVNYSMKDGDSRYQVKILLDEGSEWLKMELDIDWLKIGSAQNGVPQLRLMVPYAYEADAYRYTVPFGVIDRPAIAQDVPATGLVAALPKEGSSALALICDTKYGFRGDKDGLSLNLIRSSYDPDPYPELGKHLIHLAVGACDTEAENLAILAEQYFHPAIAYSCYGKPLENAVGKSLFHIEGAVVSSVKQAEDGNGYIIRVYNPSEDTREVKVSLPGRDSQVFLCDSLEREICAVDGSYMAGGSEVCTFRVIV